MKTNKEPTELYRKYRPKTFKAVIGQDAAVRELTEQLKRNRLPHTILLSGGSGCGKTTIARILASKIGCADLDLTEVNAADMRGVDTVREIRTRMSLAPCMGDYRAWIIDEAHKLTNDAQNALLKMLEDTPDHVYFFLCTTEPEKLINTILTRCSQIKLRDLPVSHLHALVQDVAAKEGIKLSEDAADRIVEVSTGSARQALVILNKLVGIDDEETQLEVITHGDMRAQAIDLARALLFSPDWVKVRGLLQNLDGEPEAIRRLVLAYSTSVMLGKNAKALPRAAMVLEAFSQNFYDSKRSGLVLACYEVVCSR